MNALTEFPTKLKARPTIAISQCLLGDRVRYDAQIKNYPLILDFVTHHFDVISVCPEVEIGLGVPRPPVQLSRQLYSIKITGRDDPSIDISDDMYAYCKHRVSELNSIHGYIFKSKSPSCGIYNIPVFNTHNEIITTTRGVFADAIIQKNPMLPITDETQLLNIKQCETFLQKVTHYRSLHV